MSAPKWIFIGTATLFSVIGIAAALKKTSPPSAPLAKAVDVAVETPVVEAPVRAHPMEGLNAPKKGEGKEKKRGKYAKDRPSKGILTSPEVTQGALPLPSPTVDLPNIDRIFQLFTTNSSKLPIVETVDYSSSVPWLKGRPAWIADYASHYNTSRHFIARSLNGSPDYFSQKVSEGSRFNVFRKDKNIHFFLLVDIARCKMAFYYVDMDTHERVLLKTYPVGLGRLDPSKPSGTATPLGRYTLGNRVAIYSPGTMGLYQERKIEMRQIFGTRWIPFDREVERVTSPARGYGLQGAPWVLEPASGKLVESRGRVGTYDSEGSIRLYSEDIEELYSIVLTKPTFIEIVKDFHEAKLPGVEVAAPSR